LFLGDEITLLSVGAIHRQHAKQFTLLNPLSNAGGSSLERLITLSEQLADTAAQQKRKDDRTRGRDSARYTKKRLGHDEDAKMARNAKHYMIRQFTLLTDKSCRIKLPI
jgi:hypothetical protein